MLTVAEETLTAIAAKHLQLLGKTDYARPKKGVE